MHLGCLDVQEARTWQHLFSLIQVGPCLSNGILADDADLRHLSHLFIAGLVKALFSDIRFARNVLSTVQNEQGSGLSNIQVFLS